MQRLFLTFFYTGLCPKAPGTAGTIAGAVLAFFILKYFPVETLFLLTVLISIVGIGSINKYEETTGIHDHQQIVIDEVAGVWLAICLSLSTGLIQILLCVIFFRIFDITKPSIIGRIDREAKGGLGVMGDDLVAGVLAGILSAISWQLLSKIEIVTRFNI
ncbi:MAG: phosphatidylglycerophosphatase A [Campylobacteraceae bacterium]